MSEARFGSWSAAESPVTIEYSLVVIEEMAGMFSGYEQIVVAREESYAANCVRVNDRVLVPAGYRLVGRLRERGFDPLELDMSEFQKMDGGLSCLSLRF